MSRLTDLIQAATKLDEQLGRDLEAEIAPLQKRLPFGLNFERHQPEAVELPGHPLRRGSKVRVLPPRGTVEPGDPRLWSISAITGDTATLTELGRAIPETITAAVNDLVVIAEFRDSIFPGLRVDATVERGGDKPFHTVVNGENFHALEMLTFTHAGRVDAIYIDPPYNTGAKDWKYNNHYVDEDDLYRHSKWLAFMERRLRLAKRLMNPAKSVLILTIDENEVHRISLLLEQVFPASKIQMVTVMINPAGASIIDQFSRVDEHLLFVHLGAARPSRTLIDTTPGTSTFVTAAGAAKSFSWEPFQRSGGNSRRQDTKAKFFPVYIDETTGRIVGCGEHLPLGVHRDDAPSPPDGAVAQWPIKRDGTEGCWQLSAPTFRQYLSEGRIKVGRQNARTGRYGLSFITKGHLAAVARGELEVLGRDEQGALIIRNAAGKVRSQIGKTMWTNGAYSATEHGSTLLKKLLPRRRFPFPKSLYAVEDALRYYIGDNPDAIVLDPFAGSGTTMHAVARLNRQDGGRRQSILITNNEVSAEEQDELRLAGMRPGDEGWEEHGICEHITKPRVRAAITGINSDGDPIEGEYRFVDEFPMAAGLDENAAFMTLTYESPWRVSADRAFSAIAPILWYRAGSVGPIIEDLSSGWAITSRYGVLRDLDEAADFLEASAQNLGLRMAYVITDDERRFQMVAADLPDGVETVRLYEDYIRNFEISMDL